MKINVPLSEKKELLFSKHIIRALKLRPDNNGEYTFAGRKVSEIGLGKSILRTVEDTYNNSEIELTESLAR